VETAIYGRVSTEEQALEGYSIRGQVEKLKSYVSAKSWSIYDVYLDEGISGKNLTARPAITRMIEDVKAGHVKNVLIYKLDRLTRSVADLVYLIDLFKTYDCAFSSLSESIDTSTASGRMFVKIIGIFAEFERENIGERVSLGKERKAREGYTTAGKNISYGYNRGIGERVQTINETEAAVVRRAFDMYANQNKSTKYIARTFNLEKIPTKHGKVWNSGTVLAMLTNPNLAGNVRYGMEQPERYFEVEGKHEAIISEDLYNETQMLLEKRRFVSPTKQPSDDNYFSGFLYCGLCGKKLIAHNRVQYCNKREIRTNGFSCFQKAAGVCAAKSLTAKKFERAFIEYIAALDVKPDIEKEKQAEEAKKAMAARIETLREKLTILDAKEKEILDSYIEDNASLVEYRGVKAQLDSERERINAEIAGLTPTEERRRDGATSKEDIISIFRASWSGFTNIEKRQFLVRYIKKIVVINQSIPGSRLGVYQILEAEFNSF